MQSFQTRFLLASHEKNRTGSQLHGSEELCIDKNFQTLMRKFNCCTSLQNETCEDDEEIPYILWFLTSLIIVVLFLHLCSVCRGKPGFLDNILGKLVFAMGIFMTLVTQFSTIPYLQEESDNVTVWFNIAVNVLASLAVIVGHCWLFEKPVESEHTDYPNCCTKLFKRAERYVFGWATDDNIGSQDRGMGLVIFVVSLALVVLEIILVSYLFETQFFFFLSSFLVEKAVQTFFYIRIRKRNPREGYEKGAAFYFNFLAFLNFTWWLNSISFAEIRIYRKVVHIPPGFRYIDDTYKALLIDYRLLCALLFLEHSVAISANIKETQQEVIFDNVKKTKTVPQERFEMLKHSGKFTGFCSLIAGVICSAAEAATFSELVASYIWHIALDLALVVFGLFLLKSCKDKEKGMFKSIFHKGDDIEKVELMVLSMGAASIVYLLSFAFMCWFSLKHERPVEYMILYGFVLLFRGLSLGFLLFLYTGVPLKTMETVDSHESRWNYALVSALFVGLFTRFVASIIDEQLGHIHDIAHHHMTSKKFHYLRDLFALGPLFQLATCLHLLLHFLLMLIRLLEKPKYKNVQVRSVDGTAAVVPEQGNVENYEQLAADQAYDNPVFKSAKRKQTAATDKSSLLANNSRQ